MLKKHWLPLGISIALILLYIATLFYPGGSQYNANAVGFDWQNNYLSNLFSTKAVNGLPNTARIWAIGGVFFLSVSFGLFFIHFSKKIPLKSASNIIKYFGVGATATAFLVVSPYHDSMVSLSSVLALVAMFYITVFVFKSGLHYFKVFSLVGILVFYGCNYLYYTRSYLEYLPMMQKLSLFISLIWILGLHYFTTPKDFEQITVGKRKVKQT